MCSSDSSTTTTRSIVTDYFNWRLTNKTATTTNRLYMIIRSIASDCETKYYSQQPPFYFRVSSSSLIDVQNNHYEIAKELFDDGTITWSRIITFISFSAILAECLMNQQQLNIDFVISSIIDWTTSFIDTDLYTWLESQNYWAGCLKFYEKTTAQRRNSISRYASILGTLSKYILIFQTDV
ncbi:unnamed protein product [Rotaria magnacalcarata]|uniref:Bcl-2 Bcl-2 homology region 1-3 domain-containing protein n=3 Tax=Rotaria magnacalcarata TaxID=392030 RepID=A0A819AH92_9BILA|nr:unnamed protein product [Rotaria magnacalcarata]CAF1660735.1 unnamed protein product [Rotaria magnacalcarata]CAF2018491.1 unnamed protein product [Rotaria magnacalcarata]CAF2055028.1 unnamed protein product [Rotaria magnacalcarata]CAF2104804.1 unnamed protein product [Rotaria magnacalcarata]